MSQAGFVAARCSHRLVRSDRVGPREIDLRESSLHVLRTARPDRGLERLQAMAII